MEHLRPLCVLGPGLGRGGEVGTADAHALHESQRPPRWESEPVRVRGGLSSPPRAWGYQCRAHGGSLCIVAPVPFTNCWLHTGAPDRAVSPIQGVFRPSWVGTDPSRSAGSWRLCMCMLCDLCGLLPASATDGGGGGAGPVRWALGRRPAPRLSQHMGLPGHAALAHSEHVFPGTHTRGRDPIPSLRRPLSGNGTHASFGLRQAPTVPPSSPSNVSSCALQGSELPRNQGLRGP